MESNENPYDLSGRVVLITGAGKGLGRAFARAFAGAGAVVAANDLTPVNLDETIAQVRASNGKIQSFLADIAKSMPARALIADVMDEFGRLDVLINNAGVTPRADLLRVDEWDWQRTLDVNLSGPMYLIQAGVQAMQPEGGVIINIAGELPGEHAWPQQAGYYASKAGLAALTQAAAPELLQHKVRMYAVCPEDTQPGSAPVDESSYLPVTQLALELCRLTDAGPVGQVLHPGSIDRHTSWTRP